MAQDEAYDLVKAQETFVKVILNFCKESEINVSSEIIRNHLPELIHVLFESYVKELSIVQKRKIQEKIKSESRESVVIFVVSLIDKSGLSETNVDDLRDYVLTLV